ncbi:MAG: regulatory protein RecX [Treponema sp.]|jgi:regulatory protein|uniref:regulatory protein RecX n=1 Tax=Treponema sp. TaxID=166 RepID=UPI00257D6A29|nr:regulatory protein RecX [Treponema sp.]MBQ5538516.1 regulatory protein RecX [Treponema sp.]
MLAITEIRQTSSEEIVKMTSSDGAVFFVRKCYLNVVSVDSLVNRVDSAGFGGAVLSEEESEDVVSAAFAFGAETKAAEYLARCEQCRFKLAQKLLQKKFPQDAVDAALDRLESKGLLDDSRFASAWVRSHCATKYQGRSRLLSELLSRGISREVAVSALDSFFSGDEDGGGVSEEEMCAKALGKGIRLGKSGDKLLKYLLDCGFPYGMARRAMRGE